MKNFSQEHIQRLTVYKSRPKIEKDPAMVTRLQEFIDYGKEIPIQAIPDKFKYLEDYVSEM